MDGARPSAVVFERVATMASLVVRHVSAYGDLLAEDLSAAWASLGQRLWLGVVLAAAVLLFVQMACVCIVAMTWDTPHRQSVIGGLALLFLLVAGAAGAMLRTVKRSSPPILHLSAKEWEKDQQLLDEILAPTPAGTP